MDVFCPPPIDLGDPHLRSEAETFLLQPIIPFLKQYTRIVRHSSAICHAEEVLRREVDTVLAAQDRILQVFARTVDPSSKRTGAVVANGIIGTNSHESVQLQADMVTHTHNSSIPQTHHLGNHASGRLESEDDDPPRGRPRWRFGEPGSAPSDAQPPMHRWKPETTTAFTSKRDAITSVQYQTKWQGADGEIASRISDTLPGRLNSREAPSGTAGGPKVVGSTSLRQGPINTTKKAKRVTFKPTSENENIFAAPHIEYRNARTNMATAPSNRVEQWRIDQTMQTISTDVPKRPLAPEPSSQPSKAFHPGSTSSVHLPTRRSDKSGLEQRPDVSAKPFSAQQVTTTYTRKNSGIMRNRTVQPAGVAATAQMTSRQRQNVVKASGTAIVAGECEPDMSVSDLKPPLAYTYVPRNQRRRANDLESTAAKTHI